MTVSTDVAESAKPAAAAGNAEQPVSFEWTRASGGELVCDLCPSYHKVGFVLKLQLQK
jgi:hypothetical protein